MLSEKATERLLVLITLLEDIPRERFDYSDWVNADWQGNTSLSCGTSACALGHAAAHPTFRKEGLRLVAVKEDYYWLDRRYYSADFIVDGEQKEPISAAADFFDIDWHDAEYLFAPTDGDEMRATPKQVAKKIRKWMEEKLVEEARS